MRPVRPRESAIRRSVLPVQFRPQTGTHRSEGPPPGSAARTGLRIAIVTDAWKPQVNGVVTTLSETARCLTQAGHVVKLFTPLDFWRVPCPTYPEIRLSLLPGARLGRMLDEFAPQRLHIATEGPLGIAARRHCLRRRMPFTTSYHTQFPQYLRARLPIPTAWSYAFLRWFHGPALRTLVATESMRRDLYAGYRFGNELARHLAAADVFVFPSRTDTFGLVLLEALACGVPVAAYPVSGPIDVIEAGVTGALAEDLNTAVRSALDLDPAPCREAALRRSWEAASRQFLDQLARIDGARTPPHSRILPST